MSDPITVEKFAVGQSVRRLEDPRLIQGLGRYSDDVNLPRQAYAVVVRSPHAHARIRGIDTAAALKAPGVIAVLTGDDLAADKLGNLPTDGARKRRDGSPAFATPRPALVRGRVRHVGDPVALVVAETRGQAADAADLVAVDYEPLPAVAGAAEATRRARPRSGTRRPTTWPSSGRRATRDAVARAFARAAHVTRLDFVVTRVAAAPHGAARGGGRVRPPHRPLHAPHRHPGARTASGPCSPSRSSGSRTARCAWSPARSAAASACGAASIPSSCSCCGPRSGSAGR